MDTLNRITNQALEKGKQKAKEVYEENLAQALRNGAGPAHKMTAIDKALPPLRLVLEEQTAEGKRYITEPMKVAAIHTKPWAQEWRAGNPEYFSKIVVFFKNLCKTTFGGSRRIYKKNENQCASNQGGAAAFQ